jgi:hypothetical protein
MNEISIVLLAWRFGYCLAVLSLREGMLLNSPFLLYITNIKLRLEASVIDFHKSVTNITK